MELLFSEFPRLPSFISLFTIPFVPYLIHLIVIRYIVCAYSPIFSFSGGLRTRHGKRWSSLPVAAA